MQGQMEESGPSLIRRFPGKINAGRGGASDVAVSVRWDHRTPGKRTLEGGLDSKVTPLTES